VLAHFQVLGPQEGILKSSEESLEEAEWPMESYQKEGYTVD